GDPILSLLQLAYPGGGQDADALLFQLLASMGCDFLVLRRQDLRQDLHHGHLGAEGAEEACEFNSDRARSHDKKGSRQGLGQHRLEVGPDQLLVRLQAGQHARTSTGRKNDMLGLVAILIAVLALHADFAWSLKTPLALQNTDLVLLQQV